MKILVTGAGGCIGGRIVETLALAGGAEYRAMFRDPGRAYRVARFPAEMVRADMADRASVDAAVAGCDLVVHCAHDLVHPERNVPGAENLVAAAIDHGVRRFVYVSSAMVQEPFPAGRVDESTEPGAPPSEGLDVTRRDAEARCFATADGRVDVVAIRPTIVYGPYSPHWTMGLAEHLRYRLLVVPGEGRGTCNAVYVDDVVDAVLRAATLPHVDPGAYLVTGPATVTWSEFFGAFESALGTTSVVYEREDDVASGGGVAVKARSAARTGLRSALELAKHERLRPVRSVIGERLGPARTRALKHAVMSRAPRATVHPTERERLLYTSDAIVDGSRARAAFGYEPRFGFDRGMMLTSAFMRWANL